MTDPLEPGHGVHEVCVVHGCARAGHGLDRLDTEAVNAMRGRSFDLRWLVTVALVTVTLAACSSASVQTAVPTAALPTRSPSPTTTVVAPSATPCPSPAPGADWRCPGFLPTGGHFAPGTYATLFDPRVTVTVDGYGESYVDSPSWLDLQYDHDDLYIQIVRLDRVYDPKSPPKPAPEVCDICSTGGRLINLPEDFAHWLETLPGLTVVAPATSAHVGGLDASQLDVIATKDVPIGPLVGFKNGVGSRLGGGGTRFRLIAVTVDGSQVLIALSHGPLERGQRLLDSIAWH
jgi:hypothetical protein